MAQTPHKGHGPNSPQGTWPKLPTRDMAKLPTRDMAQTPHKGHGPNSPQGTWPKLPTRDMAKLPTRDMAKLPTRDMAKLPTDLNGLEPNRSRTLTFLGMNSLTVHTAVCKLPSEQPHRPHGSLISLQTATRTASPPTRQSDQSANCHQNSLTAHTAV
ncbi:hypothetical protein ACOMHN_009077 [Nucella lapillus]